MKLLRNGARYVLLALVMLSGFLSATSASFAQGNATSFVSPMTGIPINTTGPWTIDTTSVFSQDGIESITLWGPTELASVWFLPANTPLVEARDIVLDSYAQTFGTFVEIDRGAYGNVSYSLDITNSEGIEFGVFSLFLGQRDSGYVEYYVFFGSLPLFAQGFASAQQNITVNNAPIFQGVDGAGLQTLLNQNAGVTGTAGTTTQPQQPPQPQQPTTPQQPTQPQQPTEPQPPQQPTQPTTGTTGTSPEGDAYLAALDAELTYLQGTMSTFLANYTLLDETQAQELNRVGGEWGAYQQRAAGIVAPPGFEAIDAEYRSIVTNVANLGTLWQGVVTAVQNNDGTFGDKMVSLMLEVFIVEAQINELKTQIQTQGTGTTTTQPTTGTTTEPSQPPTDPGTTTTTTTGLTPEQSAYLDSIRGEVTRLQTSITDFQTKFQSLADGTSPNTQQTAQEIATIIDMWLAMPQTALQFVAPAGMEDVDAAYKQLANDFSTTATTFNTAIQQQQASDPAAQTTIETFLTQLDGLSTSLTSLNSLLDQKAQTTQTTTTQQAPPPQPTPSDPGTTTNTTTTTSADGDAYLAALQTEMTNLQSSIDRFWTSLESIQGGDQATIDQANAEISDVINYWAGYGDVAAGIVAPAGFEAVDAQYRQLASDVPLMTQFFVEFLETQEQTAKDQAQQNFIATIESVEGQIAGIQQQLGSTSTTTQQPSDPTGQTTTGTTTETPAETPATQGQGDVTETGNRGQLPNPGGNQGTTGSTGSTQGGDDAEDLGFVEEGLYISPQFDVEVTWDDRFVYDPAYLDVTISSDEEEGADSITLVWGGGEGDITVTIMMEPGEFDPADMVAFWESDEYLGNFESGAEVLLADSSSDRGAALILVGDETDGAVIYREAMCIDRGCTQVALVMTISSIDDTADIIADAEEAVEIDGESATGVFSTREINRELP